MQSNPLMSVHIETLSLLACHQKHLKGKLPKHLLLQIFPKQKNG